MRCPACGFHNLPGADDCEYCCLSLTQEDLPLAQLRGRIAQCLTEEPVEFLEPPAPVTVPLGTSLEDAVARMREYSVSCVLVQDAEGKLAGILTERDLITKVAGTSLDLSRTRVDSVLTADPETIRGDQPLAHALHRMTIGDFRHLPLTDEQGRPTGVISSREVLNYLTSQVLEIFAGIESTP